MKARMCLPAPSLHRACLPACLPAAVVVTSLVLELALHGVAQEAVALLVFFRLVSPWGESFMTDGGTELS